MEKTRKAIAFGYVIAEATAPLRNKNAFMGIEAHQKVPLELAAIAFAGAGTLSYTLLIVDTFQKMNGADDRQTSDGKAALRAQLETLQSAYGIEVGIIEASSFMSNSIYALVYSDVSREVRGTNLEEAVRKTLPEGKTDISFAIHEVAVCRYLQLEHGMDVKIGQQREKLYDPVIAQLTKLDFGYLFPFYAFITGEEVKTPYNPSSGAKNGGKRLMINDPPDKVAETIAQGPLNAQVALTRLGYAAHALVGKLLQLSEKSNQPENCMSAVMSLLEQCEIARLKRKYARYYFK